MANILKGVREIAGLIAKSFRDGVWGPEPLPELHKSRIERREYELKKEWYDKALPVLERIFASKDLRLEGLRFPSYHSSSDGSGNCVNVVYSMQNGNYGLKIIDLKYGESANWKGYQGETPLDLACQVLNGLEQFGNPARNKFVWDLASRTGINLKQEIKSNQKVKL